MIFAKDNVIFSLLSGGADYCQSKCLPLYAMGRGGGLRPYRGWGGVETLRLNPCRGRRKAPTSGKGGIEPLDFLGGGAVEPLHLGEGGLTPTSGGGAPTSEPL